MLSPVSANLQLSHEPANNLLCLGNNVHVQNRSGRIGFGALSYAQNPRPVFYFVCGMGNIPRIRGGIAVRFGRCVSRVDLLCRALEGLGHRVGFEDVDSSRTQ